MNPIRYLVNRLRGRHSFKEEFESVKLRSRYRAMGIDIGLYSYGCFDTARVPPGVTIGRYCSFAPSSQIFLRNHGVDFIGLTACLYNEALGVVDRQMIEHKMLNVGDDVWLGHNSVILPQVSRIGRGSVVAAGAVVTRDVPPYAIVAGNPATILRMRFDDKTIAVIERTRWWDMDINELRKFVDDNPELVFAPARFVASGLSFDLSQT